MSGRGRGRPPSRSAQEPVAGPSRRSARHQQQQQQQQQQNEGPQREEADDALVKGEPEPQPQQSQEEQTQDQPEAPMFAPGYQDIDPAIRGPQDASMPPPSVPVAKSVRGYIGRRGTKRGELESSPTIRSHPTTDAHSEPQSHAVTDAFPQPQSIVTTSSIADETPSRKSVRERLMSKMLPRLFSASDDLFVHLCSDRTVDAEIWEAERKALREAFDTYRVHYNVRSSDPAVDPTFVANVMQLDTASPSWQRVSRVILAANLTELLDDVTFMSRQDDTLSRLQTWDSCFLDAFAGDGPGTWDKEMKETIIEQVLMIRTQLSIFTLEKLMRDSTEPFHPYQKVAKIWCDGNVSVETVESFLGNNRETLQFKPVMRADSEVDTLARERAATRFTSICRLLPDQVVEGRELDLNGIREEYPFGDFEDSLRAFVTNCFMKTKEALHHAPSTVGGAAWPFGSSDAASRIGSQMRDQLDTQSMAHHYTQAEPGAPPLSFNVESVQLMKQMEPPSTAGYDGGYQLPPAPYSPGPRIPYPPSSPSPGGYADAHMHPGYQGQAASYAASAAQVAGRKRRSQGAPAAAGDGAAGSAAPPAKKPRARRKKGVSEANMAPASVEVPAVTGGAPVAASVAQSQYPPVPGSQDEPDYEALAQRSREMSARARKAKEPQVRSAWVRKDVTLLVRAVNTYQCKWSTIEKEIKAGTIPFERPRDQQALRDKARLLKQDFLKCDAVLPRGFDLVVLGKKEREAIKACGKNPDRKEADIDENGRPINTDLVPERPQQEIQPAPQPAIQPAPQPAIQPAPQPAIPEPTMA
ncbi:hypothetical protein C8A03DRAFT_40603 [Achaetomium macrosporum]|uniref:Myb-like domain-containing protein n=1 Tax=Achaetomium macrosporum TaxID=79813 RepID=A0AAN7CH69_9PEZI|nr:hypothetical protein C8A03DRAFT_40603 [Achaetomium macrosporum]